MEQSIFNKTEGDINLTEERARWQETFLSPHAKELLEVIIPPWSAPCRISFPGFPFRPAVTPTVLPRLWRKSCAA